MPDVDSISSLRLPLADIVSLQVMVDSRRVGILAAADEGVAAFEYDADWLSDGYALNPLSLPLERRVFLPRLEPFDGLFGVFADSLPEGWGRLLVDRRLASLGADPASVSELTRLALVGDNGMGALRYAPPLLLGGALGQPDFTADSLDSLSLASADLLRGQATAELDRLYLLGGSSGGARPKVLVAIDGEDWIVKFPASLDPPDIGLQEYAYALAAQDLGIEMPEARLFPSGLNAGYFGVRRFDRGADGARIHMASVSALLETSHRIPNLDYSLLMRLTRRLTDSMAELRRLYRLMCFNVYAKNRDDHSRNFSFVYDEPGASWRLSPAYDLTYSSSIGGEHATTVAGNGRNPGMNELLEVAQQAGISLRWATKTALSTEERTHELRRFWR